MRRSRVSPDPAHVDNDGSAEIVVVSESDIGGSATVQVIRDQNDQWVPARRIWNQHAYPAQFEGGVCKPDPEG